MVQETLIANIKVPRFTFSTVSDIVETDEENTANIHEVIADVEKIEGRTVIMTAISTILCVAFTLAIGATGVAFFGAMSIEELRELRKG